jgi:hypothetical protein
MKHHEKVILGIGFALLWPLHTASAQELSSQWWQWALSIPAVRQATNQVPSPNPLTDVTGENCVIGQRGSTWFLAGLFGGGTASRTCSIPEGTTLFFPVINNVNINTPNVCGQDANNISAATLRDQISAFINGATDLSVELDHKPVAGLQRIKSAVFAVALPENNIFDLPCARFGGAPAGIYSPAVGDGFYVQLAPLPVGAHTLRIRARNPDQNFAEDVTYNLTVVPVLRQ